MGKLLVLALAVVLMSVAVCQSETEPEHNIYRVEIGKDANGKPIYRTGGGLPSFRVISRERMVGGPDSLPKNLRGGRFSHDAADSEDSQPEHDYIGTWGGNSLIGGSRVIGSRVVSRRIIGGSRIFGGSRIINGGGLYGSRRYFHNAEGSQESEQ